MEKTVTGPQKGAKENPTSERKTLFGKRFFLPIAVAKRHIEVKIRTKNLHFCHVTAAQSDANRAATLKAKSN